MSKPAFSRLFFSVYSNVSTNPPRGRMVISSDVTPLLERKGLALEPEEIDAVGDERALLRHAQRLQIDLHLARLLPVGIDAGDVPGLARAPRDHHVLAREIRR